MTQAKTKHPTIVSVLKNNHKPNSRADDENYKTRWVSHLNIVIVLNSVTSK